MGWFKKITQKANTSLGLGKNNDLGRIGAGIMTGGASELVRRSEDKGGLQGSLTDTLLGKKSKDINPDAIANQIRNTQSKGIGELNAALDGSTGADTVRLGNAQAQKSVLTAAQDARRNAQMNMARQGLKGTSLGLGLNRSIDQSAGKDIASLNAQLPGQIRNQAIQDAQTRIGIGGINQNGMNFNTIEGQRSGGIMGIAATLAPLAGQAAGAYKDYQTGGLAAKRAGAY
jgi:hypothetical protein